MVGGGGGGGVQMMEIMGCQDPCHAGQEALTNTQLLNTVSLSQKNLLSWGKEHGWGGKGGKRV